LDALKVSPQMIKLVNIFH